MHPKRDMNLCTKFYGNKSNTGQDISFKTKNVKLMMALEKQGIIEEYLYQISWPSMQYIFEINLVPRPGVSDTPTWCTNQTCHPYSHALAYLKENRAIRRAGELKL